jgi:hypothetical protein
MRDALLFYMLLLQAYCLAAWVFETEERIWRWELDKVMHGNTAAWLEKVLAGG